MLEVLYLMIGNLPVAAIAAILAGMLRSIAGWLENALADGVIDKFEIKQLEGTVIKYFSYIMLLMLGIQSSSEILSNPIDIGTASGLAVTLTFIIELIKTSIVKMNK